MTPIGTYLRNRKVPQWRVKIAPQPMLADRIKADWVGESKEVLLAKGDMLPPGVRQQPRKYLVPPHGSGGDKRLQAYRDEGQRRRESKGKRLRESDGNRMPPLLPPPPFERRGDPMHGKLITSSFS